MARPEVDLNGLEATAAVIEAASPTSEHRFYASYATQGSVSFQSASITLNGVAHPMTAVPGTHLLTFDSPNKCVAQYQYRIGAKFSAPLYGTQFRSDPPAPEARTATVKDFGKVVWYQPGMTSHTNPGDKVFFHDGPPIFKTAEIVLLNLRESTLNVTQIGIFPSENGPDTTMFTLEVPPLPVSLACGESFVFKATWLGHAETVPDSAQVQMVGNSWGTHLYLTSIPEGQ